MRKTSVPALRGLMIAGVVVAVAAPFLGWILQALALLINSYWSIPCIDYILVEVIPCVRLGGVLLFLWGALLAIQPTRKGELTMKKCFSVIAALYA